jgi:uncharacterized protein (TIGR03089 family)
VNAVTNPALSRDPSAPFVTYYDGTTGERTELSGTSFANWQAKTANYLRDGFGLEAGDRLTLDLPLHWITPVWIAAARALAVTVSIAPASQVPASTDLLVVGPTSLAHAPTSCDVVACSLLPFAQPFGKPLPTGVEDYFAEVRNYGDHLDAPPVSPGTDPVLVLDANALSRPTTEVARARFPPRTQEWRASALASESSASEESPSSPPPSCSIATTSVDNRRIRRLGCRPDSRTTRKNHRPER